MKLLSSRATGVGYLLKDRITDVDELTEVAARVYHRTTQQDT
jgi:hypothetical protein